MITSESGAMFTQMGYNNWIQMINSRIIPRSSKPSPDYNIIQNIMYLLNVKDFLCALYFMLIQYKIYFEHYKKAH